MASNNNVGRLYFKIPHGMAIMQHVVPGQWLIMFPYKNVEGLREFTAKLAEDAAKLTVNVQEHVLAPKPARCMHPEGKRHVSEKGVFCLECNEPILMAFEQSGFSQQESPIHPSLIQKPPAPVTEVEEEAPETPRDGPIPTVSDTEPPPSLSKRKFCEECGQKLVDGKCVRHVPDAPP